MEAGHAWTTRHGNDQSAAHITRNVRYGSRCTVSVSTTLRFQIALFVNYRLYAKWLHLKISTAKREP